MLGIIDVFDVNVIYSVSVIVNVVCYVLFICYDIVIIIVNYLKIILLMVFFLGDFLCDNI